MSKKFNEITVVKIIVPLLSLVLIVLKFVLPEDVIDLNLILLLVIGLSPFLGTYIKSLEFGDGKGKIEFQDAFKDKTEKTVKDIKAGASAEPEEMSSKVKKMGKLFSSDPALTLVGLRFEIEKKLDSIVELRGLNAREKSGDTLLRFLFQKELIPEELFGILREIILAGNRVAHGEQVSRSTTAWITGIAPDILSALDIQISALRNRKAVEHAVKESAFMNFRYSGLPRQFSAHMLGFKNGLLNVFGCQFGGESSSGRIAPNWKCFTVSKMEDIELQERGYRTIEIGGKTPTCIDKVIAKNPNC